VALRCSRALMLKVRLGSAAPCSVGAAPARFQRGRLLRTVHAQVPVPTARKNAINKMVQEAYLLNLLRCSTILNLVETLTINENLVLVMEYW
jgi:hypothetical protein